GRRRRPRRRRRERRRGAPGVGRGAPFEEPPTGRSLLLLDDDVLLIFGEKVEEESGIVAVAALASSCHAFATLLQPQATDAPATAEAEAGQADTSKDTSPKDKEV
ncbi:MAG: hypothetical protein VX228_16820, partial [Pseudomonadota bacterium]|nr:hypothetical protein [Pseudomonadota bacterium]